MRKFALCAVALIVSTGSTAAFAQYAGRLDLSPSTAGAGDEITVRGAGFARQTRVQITFDQDLLGEARSDASGAVSATVRVPSDATPGRHTVRATGEDPGGGRLTLDATLLVVGPETQAGGSRALVLIVVAAAIVLGGGLFLLQRLRVAR